MNIYLRSLGFSSYQSRQEFDDLLDRLLYENIDKIRETKDEGTEVFFELKVKVSRNLYIIIFGRKDKDGNYKRELAYPYLRSKDISSNASCSLQRNISTEEHSGMIDDNRVGISIIFRLINLFDFIKRIIENKSVRSKNIYLSAWSVTGRILLPVKKTEKQKEMIALAGKERNSLIEKAREGDQQAIDYLSMEDMNNYAMVSKRLLNEDIYSIVDTSFMPYGVESDVYQVVADIIDVKELTNQITKEKVYDLTLNSNEIIFHVGITKNDVLGEPKIGRRFRGRIWLQGELDFYNNRVEKK